MAIHQGTEWMDLILRALLELPAKETIPEDEQLLDIGKQAVGLMLVLPVRLLYIADK
jgi:hypothetical protein